MTTQEMDTQEMTCTNVLEELGRIRDYHQGRADSAAILEDELKSLLGVAQATDEDPGAEPAVDPEPEPSRRWTEPRGASVRRTDPEKPPEEQLAPGAGEHKRGLHRDGEPQGAGAAGRRGRGRVAPQPDGGDPIPNRVGAAHRGGREPPTHRVPGLPGPGLISTGGWGTDASRSSRRTVGPGQSEDAS